MQNYQTLQNHAAITHVVLTMPNVTKEEIEEMRKKNKLGYVYLIPTRTDIKLVSFETPEPIPRGSEKKLLVYVRDENITCCFGFCKNYTIRLPCRPGIYRI